MTKELKIITIVFLLIGAILVPYSFKNKLNSRIIVEASQSAVLSEETKIIQPELTPDQAIQKVQEIPEVKALKDRFNTLYKKPLHFEVETRDDPNIWMVHVYEIVYNPGELSHMSTYYWLEVNKKTGDVFDYMEVPSKKLN